MMTLDKIDLEYKLSAVLGVLALVVSLLLGILAGNRIGNVLIKSTVLVGVFLALGFISGFVLKRYVPEVYAVLNGTSLMNGREKTEEEAVESVEADNTNDQAPGGDDAVTEQKPSTAIADTGLSERSDDYEELKSVKPLEPGHFGQSNIANTFEGKLGKHILEEKIVKYEPKIMAQAIRTMMSRDKE